MASLQQGSYALLFGLPDMDSNSVKTGTTANPAATVQKFKVTGISFDASHSEEVTYNTDGDREHVSTFDFVHTVTLTGHFHDSTKTLASDAANAWDLTSGQFTGMQLLLAPRVSPSPTKTSDRTFASGGKAFRVTGFRETNSTSAKATFEITAIAEAGMTYHHLS